MVWSTGKENDDWESDVHNPLPQISAAPSAKVVVDPVSQIPQAPRDEFSAARTLEPTEILRGRKVDRLRAQVDLEKREVRRRRQLRLSLWAVGGALAVGLGAFLAQSAASDENEVGVAEENAIAPVAQAAAADSVSSPEDSHQGASALDSGAVEPQSDKLGSASAAAAVEVSAINEPSTALPSSSAKEPTDAQPSAAPAPVAENDDEQAIEGEADESEAFTLDDLPLE